MFKNTMFEKSVTKWLYTKDAPILKLYHLFLVTFLFSDILLTKKNRIENVTEKIKSLMTVEQECQSHSSPALQNT